MFKSISAIQRKITLTTFAFAETFETYIGNVNMIECNMTQSNANNCVQSQSNTTNVLWVFPSCSIFNWKKWTFIFCFL